MKVYVVFVQWSGMDYYDLESPRVFLSEEAANRFDAECQLDTDNIESTYVKEYEVVE